MKGFRNLEDLMDSTIGFSVFCLDNPDLMKYTQPIQFVKNNYLFHKLSSAGDQKDLNAPFQFCILPLCRGEHIKKEPVKFFERLLWFLVALRGFHRLGFLFGSRSGSTRWKRDNWQDCPESESGQRFSPERVSTGGRGSAWRRSEPQTHQFVGPKRERENTSASPNPAKESFKCGSHQPPLKTGKKRVV